MVTARWNLDRARALDAGDVLAPVRRRFVLPEGLIYLDGNSLGALGASVGERVRHLIDDEWGAALSAGWNDLPWMDAPLRIGDRIAPLIGAGPSEVLVADTTSIVLAKAVGAAVRARPSRRVVVSSADNFPSDLFSAMGAAELAGAELRVVERASVAGAIDEEVAVVCLTHVDFRTGELYDIPTVTEAAHRAGALMCWDLCHSVGAVPVGCEEHDVDLAVGCTYKYLNGGPGAPSFMYVRRRLQDRLENPLPGWLGHQSPFDFERDWRPADGIRKFLTSTPPVLAMAALEAALDAFDGVAISDVRAKSMTMTQLFIDVVRDTLEVASPLDAARRGSQVALRHPEAQALIAAASARGVVGDFRAPDLCRFGFAPLYLSYEDVFRAAEVLVDLGKAQ
jgi:kynureninase